MIDHPAKEGCGSVAECSHMNLTTVMATHARIRSLRGNPMVAGAVPEHVANNALLLSRQIKFQFVVIVDGALRCPFGSSTSSEVLTF